MRLSQLHLQLAMARGANKQLARVQARQVQLLLLLGLWARGASRQAKPQQRRLWSSQPSSSSRSCQTLTSL
jgi:hypothetical protein